VHFAVVDEVLGHGVWIANGEIFSEHEQSRNRRALLSGLAISAPASQPLKELAVLQRDPGMVAFRSPEPLPVLRKARFIEVVDREVWEQPVIRRLSARVGDHPPDNA
jgi:hypothetical protein